MSNLSFYSRFYFLGSRQCLILAQKHSKELELLGRHSSCSRGQDHFYNINATQCHENSYYTIAIVVAIPCNTINFRAIYRGNLTIRTVVPQTTFLDALASLRPMIKSDLLIDLRFQDYFNRA